MHKAFLRRMAGLRKGLRGQMVNRLIAFAATLPKNTHAIQDHVVLFNVLRPVCAGLPLLKPISRLPELAVCFGVAGANSDVRPCYR